VRFGFVIEYVNGIEATKRFYVDGMGLQWQSFALMAAGSTCNPLPRAGAYADRSHQ